MRNIGHVIDVLIEYQTYGMGNYMLGFLGISLHVFREFGIHRQQKKIQCH